MPSSKNQLFLVRTYLAAGMGGPIPPLELLYLAKYLQEQNPQAIIKIIDTGLDKLAISANSIYYLYALAWEADYLHTLAKKIKNKNNQVIATGPLASLVKDNLLKDKNIDQIITGEKYLNDLDLPPELWQLIDFRKYANFVSWNGENKHKFYIPILTSRGCPYQCTFCSYRFWQGNTFQARPPEEVVEEINFLVKKYHCREFHIYDPVFNFDLLRAKKILQLIAKAKLKVALAFPHGLRIDKIDAEFIGLLKKAGTYKVVFGLETGAQEMQKYINKNINLNKAKAILKNISDQGIITAGYFILGLPGETETQIWQTINFAKTSALNLAFFFKYLDYSLIQKKYHSATLAQLKKTNFLNYSYFGLNRGTTALSSAKLNDLLIQANTNFYLDLKRTFRNILIFPNLLKYLHNLLKCWSLLVYAKILNKIKC